jgi:macrolide-specific efflux system membrane fusion protein
MKLKVVALVMLVAVGVGAVALASGVVGANAADTTQFLTSDATVGDVTDDVAATGTLAASESYGLIFGADPYVVDAAAAPVSEGTWPVTDVAVKVGDTVAKGDVLATADTADLAGQLETASADVRTANINIAIADENLTAAQDAGDTDAERQAKIALNNAKNQKRQASDTRSTLQAKIKAAKLTAPIDGLVTQVAIRTGFDAPSGPAIVVASTTYQVTTDVVESDLADIKVGQTASVAIDALSADVEGTVSAISPVAADATSGVVAFPVTVTLTAPPDGVRAGMSADVTITIASATGVLTVPSSALQGSAGAYTVRTLGADGTPQQTPVEVGLLTSSTAEITSGLNEGTAVITGTTADRTGTTTTTGGGGLGGGGLGGGGAIPGGGFPRGNPGN